MTNRPNILLVTSDQHHWRAVGRRTPGLQTPALDRLADEGAGVLRAYCPNPTCSPSRASIITGQYPSWHGCWSLGTKLPEDRITVGHLLHDAGYRTSLIGKAHFQPLASTEDQPSIEAHPLLRDLGFWKDFSGPWYGFDHVELARMHGDEAHVGQHYALWLEEQGFADWRDYFRSWPPSPNDRGRFFRWDLPVELHYSRWTADRTMAAIDTAVDDGTPFFCWASFHDPHPPYLAPEPYASMYDAADMEVPPLPTEDELARATPWVRMAQEANPDFSDYLESGFHVHGFTSHVTFRAALAPAMAVYFGMISMLDQQLGRVLDHLDARGLTENTLVIFTTDHGNFFGQHGLVAKGPFHYEDLIRLPFYVRYPGRVPAGSEPDALLSLVDLAPTMLTAAGVPVPGWMQGVDQLPTWAGEQERSRDHVIVEDRFEPSAVHLRTYVDDRYKLTVYRGRPWGELFDLEDDPGEVANRYDDPGARTLRSDLLERFLHAELAREPTPTRRVANA